MKKGERQAIRDYIRQIADIMELRDWRFEFVVDKPAPKGAYACIDPVYGQRHARLQLCENFRTLDAKTQREIICHELIHCHLAGVQDQIECDLKGQLAKPAEQVLRASFIRSLEYAVNGLEFALAKHLPDIQWS